jgi:hypothetical protein
MKDVFVHRNANLNTDHFLLITTLTSPSPRWENKQNLKRQGNATRKFYSSSLNDGIVK